MYSRFGAPLNLLRKLARDERGRVGLGLAAGLVVLAALAGLVFSITTVLAHHPTYTATADCYGWDATSTYVGAEGRRLILIENVVINGAAYQPSWSNNSADPPPNDSGDGGNPVGTNRVIPFNSYTGPKNGITADGVNDYLWVGVDNGWTIFDKDEGDLGPLDTGPGKWGGAIEQYWWQWMHNEYEWVPGGGDPSQVNVYAPTAPTNCSRIIIDKVTDPRHDPQSFAFTLTKTGFTTRNFNLTDDAAPYDTGIIPSGTYNASEAGPPAGWVKTSATCSDGSPPNAISLQSGETVTCTFNNTKKGRIIIDKVTNPSGDPQSFGFTLTGGPSALNQNFSLADATTPHDSGLVLPGSGYNASESVPAGWGLASATCSDGSPVNNIDVGPGETVTCTFTNTKKGRIIVDKVTNPSGDAQSFGFTLVGGPSQLNQSFSLADASTPHDSGLVLAGSGYNASETVPPGWGLTSATCSDGSPVNNIDVGPGETVTCTFTNTKRGRIIIDKVTNPSGDAQSFDFTLIGGPSALNQSFSLADATTPHDSGLVLPGSGYNAAETVPAGWDLTSATCSDGSPVNNINVGPGETVTCTFTNTKRGRIIVDKVTNPSGDPQSFDFTLTSGPSALNQSFSLADATTPHDGGSILPGSGYVAAETPPPADWVLTGATCDDGSPVSNISVSPGETVTCTFTNTKPPKLIVIKHVINDDGGTAVASDFTMTVTANNPSPASFPGVEAPGTLVSLDAGAYSVNEAGPSGYSAIFSSGCGGFIAVGETKTCTVSNDDIGPKLIVIKHVINDDGGTAVAADFTMTVTANSPSPASFPGVEDPGTTVSLKVGSYSVDESGPSGYSASFSADCSGSVTLLETKTCTVTNDDIGPKLIVIKHVINDDGGTAVAADFTMTVTANEPSPASFPGVETPGTTVSLKVGSYSVDESGPSGYSASFSADCSGSVTLLETKTCTVTNDDVPRGTIIVEKQTIPGGVTGSFTFSGDAAGSISDNGQIVVTNLPVGTYTSAEVDLPPGFDLISIVCDDDDSTGNVGSATATFRLGSDEVVKCTFTNRLEATPTPSPTPSPTPTSTPGPSPTPTPTSTSTPGATPEPTGTPGLTPTPTSTPIIAPETLTPKPTPTSAPAATATPVPFPGSLPPSGWHAAINDATWPWFALGAAGILALLSGLAWVARERREQQ